MHGSCTCCDSHAAAERAMITSPRSGADSRSAARTADDAIRIRVSTSNKDFMVTEGAGVRRHAAPPTHARRRHKLNGKGSARRAPAGRDDLQSRYSLAPPNLWERVYP